LRYLILLIIIFLVFKFWPQSPPPTAENSFIGDQIQPMNKAKDFSDDYDEALDAQRRNMDQQLDGG
jgi:hypothetical protein